MIVRMKTETDNKAVVSDGRTQGVGAMALRDLINITWRMAVPTILGLLLGVFIGEMVGYKAAGFLIGAVLGFGVGLYLAVKLLKAAAEAES